MTTAETRAIKSGQANTLAEWQVANCEGCRFADGKLVGTGEPCCQFPGRLQTGDEGQCLSHRSLANDAQDQIGLTR